MAGPASVEEYRSALPDEARAALDELRAIIRSAAPAAVEVISYQIPTFKLLGRGLVSCAAFTAHCSLFPASGMVVSALGDELTPYLAGKATIRFPLGRPIPEELVRRVVAVRIDELGAARPSAR